MGRQYKNSGIDWIGFVPDSWAIAPTKRYFRYGKDKVGAKSDDYERLALTMSGVIKRNKDDNEGLQPEKFDGYQVLKPNELVFKLIDLANVKTSRVGLSPYLGIVSPAYIIIRNQENDNRFYYYWFMFMYYNLIFNHMGDDGVRSALSPEDVLNIPIPIIPLDEQYRIADYLDKKCGEIDSLIELQEQMIEKLKAYKQSVITEAVTKGLNPNAKLIPSGIDWIGEIPEHWEVCRFKDIASVKANLVHPDDYLDFPQIAPDNIEKGSGRLLHYKSVRNSNVISDNHLFYKGQIVYSKIRPVLNKLIIAPFDGLCSADMYPIETENDINYQKYYMLSAAFISQVALVVQDRVKMPKINKDELSVIYVLSLPLPEQQAIASYLDGKCSEIDNLIAMKQHKIEKLKDYKKSVIYEAVTGKIIIE